MGNIIINKLANITSTSAHIYVAGKENEYVQSKFLVPQSRAINKTIHLFKKGQYYEPIVNWNFERKGIVKNKGLS